MSETLAPLTDLTTLLGIPATDPRAELALRRASSAFIDAVGFPVLQVVDDTVLLRGDGSPQLLLPVRPVASASVLQNGETVTASTDPDSPVVLDRRLGVLTRADGWRGLLQVTFTHGWPVDKIPGGISDVVLERATHLYETSSTFQTTGPFGLTAAAAGGVTQRWADVVERYRVGVGDRS